MSVAKAAAFLSNREKAFDLTRSEAVETPHVEQDPYTRLLTAMRRQPMIALEDIPGLAGVSPEDAADWIRAGARAVGIGSGLTKGADPAARVKTLLASLREARPAS